MSIEDFWRSMDREKRALQMHQQHEIQTTTTTTTMTRNDQEEQQQQPLEGLSRLSLKEGEKIHINLKKGPSKRSERRSHGNTNTTTTAEAVKTPPLLRKPPPPASSTGTTPTATDDTITKSEVCTNLSGVDSPSPGVENVDAEEEEDWGDFEGV